MKVSVRINMTNFGKLIVFLIILFALGGVLYGLHYYNSAPDTSADYKNIAYTFEGQQVVLVNGMSEVSIPNSSSKITTKYFGNEAVGDLNGDGVSDVAFLVTQTSGGSGTFYYIVAALKTEKSYTGTNAVLLGDRIAPQTTQITSGKIVVNYADRAAGEPMTTTPSRGVTKSFKITGVQLVEIKTQDTTGNPGTHTDLIRLTEPSTGDTVTSPLTVSGTARGTWYFEASFPVSLLDANGKELVSVPAQAQDDWMTTEFVPFSVTLTFTKPTTTTGILILRKDNPSGLPEKEDFIQIPVKF